MVVDVDAAVLHCQDASAFRFADEEALDAVDVVAAVAVDVGDVAWSFRLVRFSVCHRLQWLW